MNNLKFLYTRGSTLTLLVYLKEFSSCVTVENQNHLVRLPNAIFAEEIEFDDILTNALDFIVEFDVFHT